MVLMTSKYLYTPNRTIHGKIYFCILVLGDWSGLILGSETGNTAHAHDKIIHILIYFLNSCHKYFILYMHMCFVLVHLQNFALRNYVGMNKGQVIHIQIM